MILILYTENLRGTFFTTNRARFLLQMHEFGLASRFARGGAITIGASNWLPSELTGSLIVVEKRQWVGRYGY